jgi:hypothetical protein
MEKKLAIIIVFVVIASLSIAGCTKQQLTAQVQTPSGSSNIAVTINSQQTANQIGSGFFAGTPQAGNKFLIFDVTVTNQNENNWPIGSPLYFKLTTADHSVHQYSSSTYYLGANALTLVSGTNPGEKVTGQIAFEIPQSATAKTLTYNDGFGNEVVLSTASAPMSTPSGSPSSNPSLISPSTSSPTPPATPAPTVTATPTATPTPGSAGHVTVSALPGCPYCAADIANLRAQGYAVTVLYPGDPGFVNNATSYPVIQYG